MTGSLDAVSWPVTCVGQPHALRWDGELTAPDHPDTDRERALAGLGGEPALCVQILDAWHRHVDDLQVLVEGSRGPQDVLSGRHPDDEDDDEDGPVPAVYPGRQGFVALSGVVTTRSTFGWIGHGTPRRYADYGAGSGRTQRDDLRGLLSLGAGLPHRLAATVIATWAERIEAEDARVAAAVPRLDAALYGRFRAALAGWFAGLEFQLDLTMVAPGTAATLERDGRVLRAAVPFSWLRDTWVPGFAVVHDRLCLDARRVQDGWHLATVDRDLVRRPLTVAT